MRLALRLPLLLGPAVEHGVHFVELMIAEVWQSLTPELARCVFARLHWVAVDTLLLTADLCRGVCCWNAAVVQMFSFGSAWWRCCATSGYALDRHDETSSDEDTRINTVY